MLWNSRTAAPPPAVHHLNSGALSFCVGVADEVEEMTKNVLLRGFVRRSKGRRSICYDREALESRKEHKPEDNAIDMAAAMGIELLTEEQYRALQKLGDFDTKTSSWVKTPSDIRKLGGAIFCDRRYDTVFVYHNGAESYYAARAFRGSLRVQILDFEFFQPGVLV